MGKILAIDYGEKRIGLAVTDDMKMIAFGLTTIATPEIFEYLADYIANGDSRIIVSASEVHIAPFLVKLAEKFPKVAIKRHDERFTSKMAFQTMLDSGLKKKQRKNKALIDEISATIILQDFLKTV